MARLCFHRPLRYIAATTAVLIGVVGAMLFPSPGTHAAPGADQVTPASLLVPRPKRLHVHALQFTHTHQTKGTLGMRMYRDLPRLVELVDVDAPLDASVRIRHSPATPRIFELLQRAQICQREAILETAGRTPYENQIPSGIPETIQLRVICSDGTAREYNLLVSAHPSKPTQAPEGIPTFSFGPDGIPHMNGESPQIPTGWTKLPDGTWGIIDHGFSARDRAQILTSLQLLHEKYRLWVIKRLHGGVSWKK